MLLVCQAASAVVVVIVFDGKWREMVAVVCEGKLRRCFIVVVMGIVVVRRR